MTGALNVLARISQPMAAVLAQQEAMAGPDLSVDPDPVVARENYAHERRYWNEGGPVMESTTDIDVPTPDGSVEVRLYRPAEAATPSPCILFAHGGGFVVGSNDTHDRIMRILADETNAVVAGIDYHLAPEAQFPQAINECVAVAKYLRDHGQEWGIDGQALSMAGDSGGATLSMATAIKGAAEHNLRFQSLLLYYGMFGLEDSPSQRLLGGPWDGLTRDDLDFYRNAYLGDRDPRGNPLIDLLSADLTVLPPCFIAAVDLDPLRDDSLVLAEMCDERQVPNELRRYPGVLHGFLHYSRMLPLASVALRDGAVYFRRIQSDHPNS